MVDESDKDLLILISYLYFHLDQVIWRLNLLLNRIWWLGANAATLLASLFLNMLSFFSLKLWLCL